MIRLLSNALGAARDKAVEVAARAFINRKIEQFGNVTRLEIDPKQKTVFLEAALNGETSPVTIRILRYELTEKDGESYVTVQQVDTSREWLTAATNQYAIGRPFKIPSAVKSALG